MTSNDNENNDDVLKLRILQINDVYLLENFAHFKTIVDQTKQQVQDGIIDKYIATLSGDFLGPALLSSLDKGKGIVDIMIYCGITHICFGNHETDIPDDALIERINQVSNYNNNNNQSDSNKMIWLNTNMKDIDNKLNVTTYQHDIITIEKKNKAMTDTITDDGDENNKKCIKVGLLGLLTEDPAIYRPNAFGGAKIEPIIEYTENYLKENLLINDDVDIIIPLTHQNMPREREFATKFGGNIFPIILGGHDHEPYDETHNGSRIIKTGIDAHYTGIIDITWNISNDDDNDNNKPINIDFEMVKTNSYPKCPDAIKRIECHERVLIELEKTKIFKIEDWIPAQNNNNNINEDDECEPFSTYNNRLGYSNGSEAICTMLRMSMRTTIGLCTAGAIRRNYIYNKNDHDWFSLSDLKAEMPFSTEMVILNIPGHVVEDIITYSRKGIYNETTPIADGGYIHHCTNVTYSNETRKIESINGKPFDPNELYSTCIVQKCLVGLDNNVPLLEWVKEQQENGSNTLPLDEECGKPAKLAIVEFFSTLMWLELGSFDDIDTNGDGMITRDEVCERVKQVIIGSKNTNNTEDDGNNEEADIYITDLAVDNIMDVADLNNDGTIDPIEMMVIRYVACDLLHRHKSTKNEMIIMSDVVRDVMKDQQQQQQQNDDGCLITQNNINQIITELWNILDIDDSGTISREEAMNAVGEIRHRCLVG